MQWLYRTNPVAKENHRLACRINDFKSGRIKTLPDLTGKRIA
jgi:hypothetical protein